MLRPDYIQLRKQALQLAEEDATGSIPPINVRITDLDYAALSAFRQTWTGRHPSGYGGFDWIYLWNRLCRQEVRNFRCALWHDTTLCGMAIGTVPRGHSYLTMRYIEGNPQGHPLRGSIAQVVLLAAEYYGRGLRLPQIRLENPAPGLEARYRDLGFSLAYREGTIRYLAMNLTYGGNWDDDEPAPDR